MIKYFPNTFLKKNLLMLLFSLMILVLLFLPNKAIAIETHKGQEIFLKHCAGCHVNGNNIVRRKQTLKLKDLKRNNLDNPEAIARIAREGIGIMSGYEEVLGESGDKLVASWIWDQAQNAWTH